MESNIEDGFKNPILAEAIKFWSAKHSSYEQLLRKLYGMLTVIDAITLADETEESVINDFVAGLVLIVHKDEERDGNLVMMPDINRLTKPMVDIIVAYLRSEGFNKSSIEHFMQGDEKLLIDGLEVPITQEKLIQWWQVEKIPVLSLEDAISLQDEYIEHRKGKRKLKQNTNKNEEQTDLSVVIRPHEIKKKIEEYFSFYDESFFFRPEDQDAFIDLLIEYYVKNLEGRLDELIIPSTITELKRRTKTKIARLLTPIYSAVDKLNPLIHNKRYLAIIRTLNHFSKLSDREIYDAITKKPRFYR